MNTVSVKQAILRGKLTVIFPAVAIVLTGLVFTAAITIKFHDTPWAFLIGMVGGFVLGWLYWSFAITYWRIWAFDNVRNVHELKRNAIRAKIIWKEGSFAEKTEIRTAEQREKLRKIERKFSHEDVFHDDLAVPKETHIGYSKLGIAMGLVFLPLVALGTGFYIYIREDQYYFLLFAAAFSIYLIYQSAKKFRTKGAVIMLNDAGIQLQDTPFLSWAEITKAEVVFEQHGKYQQHFLVVESNIHHAKLDIAGLETNFEKLEHWIQVYRVRFQKQHPNHR